MKILYVASNPKEELTLKLLQEITLLQTQLSEDTTSGVKLSFLPKLPFEQLSREVRRERPDILHISAHGSTEGLMFSGLDEKGRTLGAKDLRRFLSSEHPPRLVVLSACNSVSIAKSLKGVFQIIIGIEAEISVRASREPICTFYENLARGLSVKEAFEISNTMIEKIDNGSVRARLFPAKNIDPEKEFFYTGPRIVAKLASDNYKPNKEGEYEFRLGVFDCPANTHQVMFFTDDEELFDEKMLSRFCSVTKGTAPDNRYWTDDTWLKERDFRIFAAGVAADGKHFMVASLLTEALLHFWDRQHRNPITQNRRLQDLVTTLSLA